MGYSKMIMNTIQIPATSFLNTSNTSPAIVPTIKQAHFDIVMPIFHKKKEVKRKHSIKSVKLANNCLKRRHRNLFQSAHPTKGCAHGL